MRVKSNYLTVIAAAAAVMGTSLIGFTERAEAHRYRYGWGIAAGVAAGIILNEVYRYPRPYYYRRNYYYGGYPYGYDDTYYYGGGYPYYGGGYVYRPYGYRRAYRHHRVYRHHRPYRTYGRYHRRHRH